MIRHFTATGFVVHGNATLLHWHERVQEWLPPGGHVEPNEDLVQATLREIREETGFDVDVAPTQPLLDISNLEQVPAPYAIMIEDVVDAKHGEHQHIDHIYFTRLVNGFAGLPDGAADQEQSVSKEARTTGPNDRHPSENQEVRPDAPSGWRWVTLSDLQTGKSFPLPNGDEKPPPEDVLKLGEAAIRHVSGI